MRAVRPTVNVLKKMLPDEGYTDAECRRLLKNLTPDNLQQTFDQLNLNVYPHNLLEAARRLMGNEGTYKRNGIDKATRLVGCRVLEVRDRHEKASGYRGAIMTKDEAGDPWLIHAGTHDSYCEHLVDYLKNSDKSIWLPRKVDYKIRTREEVGRKRTEWR